jgi:crotonobetainyl-CoA:carnitine CoA-transferase CaiB-like acyl-CoA transferase
LVSKVERKQKQAKITASYLGHMSTVNKKACKLDEQLEAARQRALQLAEKHKIRVEELDLPVHDKAGVTGDAEVKMTKSRSLTPKNCLWS